MKIDWQKCVLNIRNEGLAAHRIAKKCGMDAVTAQRLARGEIKEPRFSQGLKLLDLHLGICPDKHAGLIQ
jgi:hypothetical protein